MDHQPVEQNEPNQNNVAAPSPHGAFENEMAPLELPQRNQSNDALPQIVSFCDFFITKRE